MQIAPNNEFSKLWGVIEEDLPDGSYTLKIQNSILLNSLVTPHRIRRFRCRGQ